MCEHNLIQSWNNIRSYPLKFVFQEIHVNGTQAYFGRKHFFPHANTLDDIVEMLDFLIDNMFIEFCGLVFQL